MVWHKTLNSNVQNGVVFYNLTDKICSVNKKMNGMIQQINKKKSTSDMEKNKGDPYCSVDTKLSA